MKSKLACGLFSLGLALLGNSEFAKADDYNEIKFVGRVTIQYLGGNRISFQGKRAFSIYRSSASNLMF